MDKAMCDLFVGAFFFPMRSYKYVKVQGYHKTKLLVIKNIHFFQNNVNIPHNSNKLHLADSVSINFESQKRDTKKDMITQHHSGDPILCPVIIWCKVVKHLLSYSSTTQDTTVNMFQLPNKKLHHFSGQELLKELSLAATALGPDILGFTANQIGLHSARSSAAMAMFLSGVSVFQIILLGRWASNAFLHYIRKQLKEFSACIIAKR